MEHNVKSCSTLCFKNQYTICQIVKNNKERKQVSKIYNLQLLQGKTMTPKPQSHPNTLEGVLLHDMATLRACTNAGKVEVLS